MKNFLNLNIFIIHVLFIIIIYQNVECTTVENNGFNGTISEVTKNIYTQNSYNGLSTFRRRIGIEILSAVGRKFFNDWLPSFTNYVQGRCFGAVRKIQMTFIPLFFKLGVISTILIFLTAMTAKGLLIGITLLFFNFTGFFAKLYSNKLGSQHSTPSWHYPHAASSWVQPTVVKPTIKNIHVHVHPPAGSSHHSEDHSVHYPIEEYGSTLHHRPSSLYGHKLSSLDSNDIYQHYPSVSTEYEIHNHHQPHVFEHKMDYVGNSLLPDSTGAMHSTNIYQPNLLQRYDDISTISSPGAVLTAEENAYIQRILSKLS